MCTDDIWNGNFGQVKPDLNCQKTLVAEESDGEFCASNPEILMIGCGIIMMYLRDNHICIRELLSAPYVGRDFDGSGSRKYLGHGHFST